MKKLYRKSTVHPTPSVVSEHLLSFLPAAILALTAALSPADREVLAYLISCSSASLSSSSRRSGQKSSVSAGVAARGGSKGDDHPSCFSCNCFRCYMSYWVKWDSSPNRQLIHEIIDAFEESLLKGSKKEKNKRERRKGKNVQVKISAGILAVEPKSPETVAAVPDFNYGESSLAAAGGGAGEIGDGGAGDEDIDEEAEEEEMEKGSVRRLVSFLGERIWSVWG
ncbi:hypothetical protein STAS_21827 [Striga asiatica]|uniref:Uncharacterized protein n=1 Tax=Striga asiatica TaxID=4170 RepID=A0A5A7QHU1_STRAF|nr:hypothetical protein STAS_21827 [Striga asiatica]